MTRKQLCCVESPPDTRSGRHAVSLIVPRSMRPPGQQTRSVVGCSLPQLFLLSITLQRSRMPNSTRNRTTRGQTVHHIKEQSTKVGWRTMCGARARGYTDDESFVSVKTTSL